ncbi:HNH endonuclease signature motif containing protein [Clostridium estertheticum]|uniref:HNH endonuclease signature motif containing protein n=1 Tax=Clostridium estertheticum TaxID=238834 RepID=UPI0019D4EF12|nr:HNH endonuclease signature motif containing protein [Clostridium estertheticum]
MDFVKTLFIGGAENSTYYALNELANFRMPNLGEQLNQFKNGVLFTGLFTGGAKALETAVPWIKKGASKVMDNIEKNVNKFGKYIDDLVPARAVTPDGQTVYIKNDPIKSGGGGKKVELNKQQKEYNKAVEESKNGKGDRGVNEAGDDFIGKLKGEKVALKGIKTKEINYIKRTPDETLKLRKVFDSTERKRFLKDLVNDPKKIEKLRKAAILDADIARMQDGLNAKGWQVHHKLPLDDSGTNAMDNLILIKNHPYHKVITNEQAALTRNLIPGETTIIKWPIPEGEIYPTGY